MTRSINIDGEDFAGRIRLGTYSFGESAFKGEVGFGGFDADGNLTTNVLPHKLVTVNDNAASPQRIYTGYTAARTLSRGERFKVGHDKSWDVTLTDQNAIFDDRVIRTADGNRGAETDVARVLWLLGSGYLPLDDEGVSATPTTSMEAMDYRGKYPRDVLDEAAEKAGKNYFAFYDATQGRSLWYDLATSSNYQSGYRISDQIADQNGVTYFPRAQRRTLDPSRVYSGVRVEYQANGSNTANVFVERGAISSNFRQRERTVFDDSILTEAAGSNFANAMLAMASTEEETISLEVDVALEKVNAFQPGHRVAYKGLGTGVTAFTNYRVMRRVVTPRGGDSDVEYTIQLDLTLPKITRFSGRGAKDTTGGTGTGGGSVDDAGTTDGATISAPYTNVFYESDRTTSPIFALVCSYVNWNTGWPGTGCAVGCGSWTNYLDQETWHQFTAPADADQLGLAVTFTACTATGVGTNAPLIVGWARKATASGSYLDWQYVTSIKNVTQTIYIPRPLVNWGAANSIILAPSWRCDRSAFICDEELSAFCQAYGPGSTGHFGSGTIDISTGNAGTLVVKPRSFTSGTSGNAPWVGAVGNVDGSNRTFRLIEWDGTGAPEARVDGLRVTDFTYDAGALTVTLPFAPPVGAVPLFRYPVA